MAAKVLIAHGNTQRLKRAVEDLKQAGFEVVATPDGGDAFARFFEEMPEAVITSEALPGLSGLNFARMVHSQSPQTPVVVLLEPGDPAPEANEFLFLSDPLEVTALRALLPQLEVEPLPPQPEALPNEISNSTAEVFTLAALKRFQRGSHLLALLDEGGIARMAKMAQHQNHPEGAPIIKQGEVGDGFYLVVEGQVRVTLEEKDHQEVARIGAGGFFGEMALLSDQPRSASVFTVGPATLFWFDRTEFLPLLQLFPTLREVLSGVALQRTEENLWRVLFADDAVQNAIADLGSEDLEIPHTPDTPLASAPTEPGQSFEDIHLPTAPGDIPDDAPEPGVPELPPLPYTPARGPSPMRVALIAAAAGLSLGVLLTAMLLGLSRDYVTPANTISAVDVTPMPAPKEEAEPTDLAQELAPEEAPQPIAEPTKAKDPASAEIAPAETAPANPPERKELRKAVFAAFKANKFTDTIKLGEQMRAAFDLDWETEFTLAEALRSAGRNEDALKNYKAFLSSYPTNLYADDAQFWMAEILLATGDSKGAKALFTEVANNAKSNFQTSAKGRLEKL